MQRGRKKCLQALKGIRDAWASIRKELRAQGFELWGLKPSRVGGTKEGNCTLHDLPPCQAVFFKNAQDYFNCPHSLDRRQKQIDVPYMDSQNPDYSAIQTILSKAFKNLSLV